ncbi:MAG: GlcG/HbpS family heme-binding protein [Pseudooceanicola sp.]
MNEISLRKARLIMRKTFDKGREMELKPLSVVVLDAGGHVKAFEREDGASPGRFAIAHGKAYGAVMLGMGGQAQAARVETGPGGAAFMAAANGVFGGAVVPVPGGVLVRDRKGNVIGAVGVSGDLSDNDAIAAIAGIEAASLTAEG